MPRSARKTSAAVAAAPKKATAKKKHTATEKRKSSRITKAASKTDNEEEGENNDEDEESTTVIERPRKRTKRESNTEKKSSAGSKQKANTNTNTNKTKDHQSTKKKGKNKENEEEDETMDSAEDDEREEEEGVDPLTQITAKKYGRIFTAAAVRVEEKKKQAGQRPNLPLVFVHTICDLLTVRSLFSLARVSRSAYAMVREYGELVVVSESKRSVTSDPLGDDIEFIGSVDGPVNPNPHRRLGHRTPKDSLDFRYSFEGLTSLLTSRLRHIVTSLTIEFEVDLDCVAIVSEALPHLRCLVLHLLRSKKEKLIVLPEHLRSFSVSFEMHGTSAFRQAWMSRFGTALGELEYLNESRLTDRYRSNEHANELVKCMREAPRLRFFHSSIPHLISTYEQLIAFSSTLTSLSQHVNSYDPSKTQFIFKALGGDSTSATSVPSLRTFDLYRTLTQDYIKPLSRFSSSLTSINPSNWETPQIHWLSAFTQLRVLTINTSFKSTSYRERNDEQQFTDTIHSTTKIDSKLLVNTLTRLTQLTKLRIFVHRLENDQMEVILRSLTSLCHLGIGSSEITSIACFSQIPHLVNRLDTLIMRLPKLPRDEIVHLYSLRWLSSLDISGSFSEPLYARQLFPFKSPPTQQQQQPYLRRFIPRSSNEAVPIPPIDLALQAAQRTEFNERVQSGQVCSAEMMNSDQLSLILQQLDCKEFSFAARTCRSWRSAASLKSAWSSNNTGRTLVLHSDSPQCDPNILPHLSLWRYARRVKLFVESRRNNVGSFLIGPLNAVSQLSRLESLSLVCPAHWYSPGVADSVRSFLSLIAPQLIVLVVHGSDRGEDGIPSSTAAAVHEFSRLHSLDMIDAALYIHPKWNSMVELESLKLSVIPNGSWGDELRHLSLTDKFRRLILDATNISIKQLNPFLHQLADRPVPSTITALTATVSSALPTVDSVALVSPDYTSSTGQPALISMLHISITQPDSMIVLDPLCNLPQLNDLCIKVTPKMAGYPYNIEPVVIPAWNFSQWTLKNAFTQLERFYYDGPLGSAQLLHLVQAKQIRFFTLIDHWHLKTTQSGIRGCSWTRPNRNSLLAGCMTQWLNVWTRLEEFHIEGIQIIGSELNEFTRVAETLRTFHLHHVSTNPLLVSNFSFLTHCQHLESIELNCILGLTLSPRHTWFDGITADSAATVVSANQSAAVIDRDGDTEMKSDTLSGTADITDAAATTGAATSDSSSAAAAAAAATDVAAVVAESSTSLIELIRSCPELTRMTWCLHPTDLDASVEFTLKNAKIGRQSLDVRREREWTRERYTLKTKLHNRKGNAIRIRYISCCETTVQSKYGGGQRQELISAEEKINIATSSQQSTLNPNDQDVIVHREEKEALDKKKVVESKKRKAEPIAE